VNDEFGQPFFDGGIVEVSVDEMVYEIFENVGSFISGAYNGIIQGWENNLSNQNGFVENSNGKITSAIKLSPDLKDSVIQLHFRIGTDLSGGRPRMGNFINQCGSYASSTGSHHAKAHANCS
jgi:hypothetical protein